MTVNAILKKLQTLLANGIKDETNAVYLMAEVRKFLEQQPPQTRDEYQYLKFHCDWALHARLDGKIAQKILREFNAAATQLKTGAKLHELPAALRIEIDRISKMRYFEEQLEKFLGVNELPPMEFARADGWIHFVHLYGQVVQDCPLVIKANNASAAIASVTLKVGLGRPSKELRGEVLFRVRWIVTDKAGKTGEIFVINSFSSKPRKALGR